jgi:deazaflavin-dependent oxidoreductase (nitroreductase family)
MMSTMPFRRFVEYLGHKDWFAKMNRSILPPLDKAMTKVTGGRLIALGIVPALMLTTTGKKSGLPRNQPLAYIPDGDNMVLIGSNWGGKKHPGWSYNLIANPKATARVKGRTHPVTARLLKGAEREEKWQKALAVWPAYATYEKRCAPREIRLFLLTKD